MTERTANDASNPNGLKSIDVSTDWENVFVILSITTNDGKKYTYNLTLSIAVMVFRAFKKAIESLMKE